MSTVEQIKTAAAELNADEQFELVQWLTKSDAFKERQLTALKTEIGIGLQQLENGQYTSYNADSVLHLADEVSAYGRKKLATKKRRQS